LRVSNFSLSRLMGFLRAVRFQLYTLESRDRAPTGLQDF
jgi:hypothetical protein